MCPEKYPKKRESFEEKIFQVSRKLKLTVNLTLDQIEIQIKSYSSS